MPDWVNFLNPGASAVMLYGPGGRNGMVYRPSVLVTVSKRLLVSVLMAATLAFATTAPEGSVTLPLRVERNSWAAHRQAKRARTVRRFDMKLLPQMDWADYMPGQASVATHFMKTIADSTQIVVAHHVSITVTDLFG